MCGASGTGKPYLVAVLDHAAIEADAHVVWNSLESLGDSSRRRRADNTTTRAVRKILRTPRIPYPPILYERRFRDAS